MGWALGLPDSAASGEVQEPGNTAEGSGRGTLCSFWGPGPWGDFLSPENFYSGHQSQYSSSGITLGLSRGLGGRAQVQGCHQHWAQQSLRQEEWFGSLGWEGWEGLGLGLETRCLE